MLEMINTVIDVKNAIINGSSTHKVEERICKLNDKSTKLFQSIRTKTQTAK